MNYLRALVALYALAAAGIASAEVGFYAGVGYGQADADASATAFRNRLTNRGHTIQSASLDTEDSGGRILVGLSFTDIWAIELGYVDLGETSVAVTGDIATNQTAQFAQDVANALPVMPRGTTLAAVARLRPSQMGGSGGGAADRFSIALKLGFIDADSERSVNGATGPDENDAEPYYGVMFGWDFTDNWRGVAGYEVFNLHNTTEFLSIGIEYSLARQ